MIFLAAETRRQPMHVGAVAMLAPPDGTWLREVRDGFAQSALAQASPPWCRTLRRFPDRSGRWGWRTDAGIDLDCHVLCDAVPAPGDASELWRLISELHSTVLDRHRPLWQFHVIEGMADGRIACYLKIHRALADEAAALRLITDGFCPAPRCRNMPSPWQHPVRQGIGNGRVAANPLTTLRGALDFLGQTAQVVPALLDTGRRALQGRAGPLTVSAPHTPFDVPVRGSRSVTGRVFPLKEIRLAAKRYDATVNDVIVAMCAGALRRYLIARHALPDEPLVAAVSSSAPLDVPSDPGEPPNGSATVSLTCPLGTHLADPADRLAAIRTAMADADATLTQRRQVPALAMNRLGAVPLTLTMTLGSTFGMLRPPNVAISTLVAPNRPLYWNGARLDTLYALPNPVDSQALRIACTVIGDRVTFGLAACRHAVPVLEVLADFFEQELYALDVIPFTANTRELRRSRRTTVRQHPPANAE